MRQVLIIGLLAVISFMSTACDDAFERDKPLVMASLFPQYDMARAIGEEKVDVEFLLPPGVDAHNYEPTPQKMMEVLDAELLLYTGDSMEPWVPRLLQGEDDSLEVLDLSRNVDLVDTDTADYTHDEGDNPDYADEYEEAIESFEIEKYEDDETVYAYVHDDHWHGSLPSITEGDALELSADIVSQDGEARALDADGQPNGLSVSVADDNPEDPIALESRGDHVRIHGEETGITLVEFHWLHEEEIRYTTPPINVQVVEDNQDDEGLYDPHIWMDPLNAIQMVEDIRDAFIELLPEHESTFTDNAEAYIEQLEAVHEDYSDLRKHSELDVLMHGGHNAFGYLADRYEWDYVNPYRGFSPDAEPTPQALADMVDLIDEYGIEYLFSEVQIDPKVADAIKSETDVEILYLYAAENMPRDRMEEGFTFIDVFEHNLEKFKKGLNYDGP